MATLFERKGTSVIVKTSENTYAVPANAMIYPDPRNSNFIVISHQYDPQDEKEGLRVMVSNVTGISFTDRNDLIEKLAESFFFNQVVYTPEGGIAVKLINKTGAASIKGTLITAGTDNESFVINNADLPKIMGAVYENGVADGDNCLVVIAGIGQVLLQDNTSATAGYWAKLSDTQNGRADITNLMPPGGTILALEDHSSEIGHCIETITAGIDKLAKVVMHFN